MLCLMPLLALAVPPAAPSAAKQRDAKQRAAKQQDAKRQDAKQQDAAHEADREPEAVFPPPEPDQPWLAGGFIDAGYVFTPNLPDNHLFRDQVDTPRSGELTLNQAAVYVQHDASNEHPWGVQLSLQAGPAVDAIYATEPIPGGSDGAFAGPEVFKHIGLANASFLLRKTQTKITGGLIRAPMGIGTAWTKDNWNYSLSWGASSVPFYLMGAEIEQKIARGWSVQGWVVNGWNTVADVNKVPSYIAAVVRDRGNWLAISHVYFGPEGKDLRPGAWRVHWDTLAIYDGPRWGVAGVFDFGQENSRQPASQRNMWMIGAAFAHGVLYRRDHFDLDLAARPEIMWDRHGTLTGTVGNFLIAAQTVTLSGRIWDHLLVRLEYRYDHTLNGNGFFYKGSATSPGAPGLATEQHTILGGVVGYFEHRFRIKNKDRK